MYSTNTRVKSTHTTSIRSRSAFALTTVLFVGQKILDASRGVSTEQTSLRRHAEQLGSLILRGNRWLTVHTAASETLFSPIASVEALQAMSESTSV